MTAIIFDVDGTLTDPREKIDPFFLQELVGLSMSYSIYLATGSDYAKTEEQLDPWFLENIISYSFNCSGNSVWQKGEEVYREDWTPPTEVLDWLNSELNISPFEHKTGFHFDKRPGMLNFSIVGRNATPVQRVLYSEFDKNTKERLNLSIKFNNSFKDKYNITAQIAGRTGFDIYRGGKDKSQILDYFENIPILFFGDDTQEGGNDYTLSKAIDERNNKEDKVFKVSSPSETRYLVSLL